MKAIAKYLMKKAGRIENGYSDLTIGDILTDGCNGNWIVISKNRAVEAELCAVTYDLKMGDHCFDDKYKHPQGVIILNLTALKEAKERKAFKVLCKLPKGIKPFDEVKIKEETVIKYSYEIT